MHTPETASLRRKQLERGSQRSRAVAAAAQQVALDLLDFTQTRAAAITHAKQRGLKNGVLDLEKSLERLKQQCIIHKAVFGKSSCQHCFYCCFRQLDRLM